MNRPRGRPPLPLAEPIVVKPRQARQLLGGIGTWKLYELLRTGELTKVRIGRDTFITTDSIRALVARGVRKAAEERES